MEDLLVAHQGLDEIISAFCDEKVFEGDDDDDAVQVRSSLSNLSSSNQGVTDFLDCISLLTAARQDLADTTEKMNSAKLNELSAQLIHPDIIGERVSWCQEVEKHLRTIAENKDLLIYHLQQPLVTNYLTMHYQHHKNLITLVEELVEMLNNVEMHIQLIEEHGQVSVLQQADVGINIIACTMTKLRKTLDNIVTLQTTLPDMIEA